MNGLCGVADQVTDSNCVFAEQEEDAFKIA